jgi:hypothetical protein
VVVTGLVNTNNVVRVLNRWLCINHTVFDQLDAPQS